jgi:NitT/TauT family transport system substrate-binding protein
MRTIAAALLCLAALGGVKSASAEVSSISFARQYGIAFMPLAIMEAKGFVQKNVVAAGLPEPSVDWKTFGGGNVTNEALLSGNLDFAAGGIPAYAILWDKTAGTPYEVTGLAAMGAVPAYLLTRNPNVKSIRDFGPEDRIAVPAVKASTQAIVLQMAAEKEFGVGNHDRLDPLTISRSHPDALASISTPNGDINSHFSAPPFQEISLRDPAIHSVLTYDDVFGGPYTSVVLYTTKKFREENPVTTKAIVEAMKETMAFIKENKREAAQLYLDITREAMTVDELVEVMNHPSAHFESVPQNVFKMISFLNRIGTIKRQASSWKDLYDESLHELPGS